MKNLTAILLFTLLSVSLFSQAPALIPYQAIARDAAGQPLANTAINARFTIHDNNATGTNVWQEIQTVNTNTLGLFTAQLGSSIALSSVNWGSGAKFMQVEIDLGNGFVDIGTQQMLSVPYALYSGDAANGVPTGGAQGQWLTYCNGVPTWTNNGQCPGTITALNCTSANNTGTLTQGVAANGVNSSIPYTGGGGGTYSSQTINSTGVTGLTATLAAGTFATGAGSLTYTITGTPATSGTASFALSIGGQSCTLTRTVSGTGTTGAAHSCGAANVHNPNLTYGSMTDQEGNTYKTIVIGTQEWMAENLNTSIYRNGDAIPTGLSNSQWQNTTQGAWAYYNNDASYACPYGKLYNWYACVDARGLCPTGWHVPSDEEWSIMINYLDPYADGGNNFNNVAGIAMKSAGTIEGGDGYWYYWDPSVEGTNSSGFSGLPGGYRVSGGVYNLMGSSGGWWSSTQFVSGNAWSRFLYYVDASVIRDNTSPQIGWGVLCLRD